MVLAQGKIDAVLAANPAERRSVFEEAAGISRYKERKKETERKLKAVGLDLSRVDDVLEEVEKAVRSLRYQAGMARRFVEMRDRYRELRVRVGVADRSALVDRGQKRAAIVLSTADAGLGIDCDESRQVLIFGAEPVHCPCTDGWPNEAETTSMKFKVGLRMVWDLALHPVDQTKIISMLC